MRIYLDHNATTPVHREVVDAMIPYLRDSFGNASSIHAMGRSAYQAVERARVQVAALINAQPEEIVFMSGGTEADNMAIQGVTHVRRATRSRIVISAVEHHAVLHTAEALREDGWTTDFLPVTGAGQIDTAVAESLLNRPAALVSIMLANNETGVIQPVAELARMAAYTGACLHCDAVQAAGKIPIDAQQLAVDLLSLSSHKMHGPQGVGALYVRAGTNIAPLLHGGGQEHGLRPGTYNLAAIVGFGLAAELARRSLTETAGYVAAMRDELEAGILGLCPEAVIIGRAADRLPNTVNVAFPDHDNRGLAAELDRRGIEVSTGSACSSGTDEPSHVHAAMGIPSDLSRSAIRFSLGPDTTEEEIAQTLSALKALLK